MHEVWFMLGEVLRFICVAFIKVHKRFGYLYERDKLLGECGNPRKAFRVIYVYLNVSIFGYKYRKMLKESIIQWQILSCCQKYIFMSKVKNILVLMPPLLPKFTYGFVLHKCQVLEQKDFYALCRQADAFVSFLKSNTKCQWCNAREKEKHFQLT